jgi:hypothetical protein
MGDSTLIDLSSRSGPSMAEKKKKNWIKAGDKHPGMFADKAKRAGKSTSEFASEHQHDSGKLGQEARFAENAMRAGHKARRERLYKKD